MTNIQCIEFSSIDKTSTVFILAYVIDVCNYNCSYCYNAQPRTNKILNLDRLYNFIVNIQTRTRKKIDIELIGGEPTLHPGLIDFCKKISSSPNVHCSIYSNFSASTQLYVQLLELGIGFTWSSHSQHKDFATKLDEIPFHYYKDNNINIRVMFEHDGYYAVKELCQKLMAKYQDYFEPALVQSIGKTYSNKYTDFYNDVNAKVRQKYVYIATYSNGHSELLTVNTAEHRFKNFKYWLCYAGLEYFYIHANGNIYACINQYERGQKPLGNIEYECDSMLLKSMICLYDICPCIWEVYKKKVIDA